MFRDGEIDLFYLYPCATATTIIYPCRDGDDNNVVDNGLELVAGSDVTSQFAPRAHGVARSDNDTFNEVYIRPEDVVVQVDPETRVGTKWYTGSDENSDNDDAGIIPGALVHLDFLGAAWKPYTFAISDVSPKKRPGTMEILRMDNTGFEILDADNKLSLNAGTFALDVIPLVVLFGTLGTYEVNLTMGGTNSGTAYTSTGQYTFHVGPIAELEVRDGGASLDVATGQRAYTIMAVNNGPDTASATKVTLTGLDADSCRGSATKGSVAFASGECVWTIGEMAITEVTQAGTGREGEVLTITTSAAAGTEITAAISNTEDYQVCIDSSGNDVDAADQAACTGTTGQTWHTTAYYDYDDGNDSVSIESRAGIKGRFTLTVSENPTEAPGTVTLSWPAQTELTDGSAVAYYGLLVSGDGGNTWQALASRVTGTSHSAPVEALPYGNTRHYAVFAQNRDGDRDLPFATAKVEDVVVRTRTVTNTVTEFVEVPAPTPAPPPAPPAPPPVQLPLVAITPAGQPQVGQPLTATLVNATAFRWQWLRSAAGAPWQGIEGANGPAYTPTALDAGSRLRVMVEHAGGIAGATTPTLAGTPPPSARAAGQGATVTITPAGQPQADQPLVATFLNGANPRWQWYRSTAGAPWQGIEGANDTVYTPTEQDAGSRLRVIVEHEEGIVVATTPALAGTPPEPESAATVTITPGGQPQVGQPLTATLTGGENPRWQWQRAAGNGPWQYIPGATEVVYTPTELDAGTRLGVVAEHEGGFAVATTLTLAGTPPPAVRYDADGDGELSQDEALAATNDYYAGALDYDDLMNVLNAYFAN